MTSGNAIYAQSGGVTPVINLTAAGVLENWPKDRKIYAAHNGILGLLREELVSAGDLGEDFLSLLKHTPGGIFGSARHKLKTVQEDEATYRRLFEVCKAHDISSIFYNGGNDSQDTSAKIAEAAAKFDFEITCIGLPKTIDNDLAMTDFCPGYPSSARYIAISTGEASYDVAAMCQTSTKVFIMEVMGRNAGWLAASAGLAHCPHRRGADVIVLPEVSFSQKRLLQKMHRTVESKGYCVVVISEGAHDESGALLSTSNTTDAFGHPQLGGAGSALAAIVQRELGYKTHNAVPDYLQRAARHAASAVDVQMAYNVGRAGVEAALSGQGSSMIALRRHTQPDHSIAWDTVPVPLKEVANAERTLPANYIASDGLDVTDACRDWIHPLIADAAPLSTDKGLQKYASPTKEFVEKRLSEWQI